MNPHHLQWTLLEVTHQGYPWLSADSHITAFQPDQGWESRRGPSTEAEVITSDPKAEVGTVILG